jgi:hypothetical protein
MAGIGPLLRIAASAARWYSSREGSGQLTVDQPLGLRALNFTTPSRTICSFRLKFQLVGSEFL